MRKAIVNFSLFLAVRIASVFVVQTYFVPDEYWQSLEVAHKLVFGYGYLTWEWKEGIRSYLYPLCIAAIYKVLYLLGLDSVELLVIAPRVCQALLSTYADYRFYIWTGKKKWSVFLIIISYFWFYTGSRTLINSVEAALTTIALSYYPWHIENSSYLWFVAICCFVRPTSAIVWAPLCLYHLKNTRLIIWQLLVKRFLLIGLFVFAVGTAIDSYFYGKFIFTPFEFLKWNFINDIGSFYGIHPWHWYFTAGLPTVLGVCTLPFIFAVIETIRYQEVFPIRKILIITIFVTLSLLSLVEHKEFRFILFLLPMCLYICTDCLVRWSSKTSGLLLWVIATLLLCGNAVPSWYLSTVHQRGPLDVMPHLAKIAKDYRDEANNKASIFFLMPCHSTPFYSHIHENITMRILTCEPNLHKKEDYIDETNEFYKSPSSWLQSHIPIYPKTAKPTHLVLFEPLAANISDFLVDYELIHKLHHSEYTVERTGTHILVYERYLPLNKNPWDNDNRIEAEDPIEDEYL